MNWDDYTEITTPADGDTALVHDVSETTVGEKMKRITWANIKAALKTYFDTLFAPITGSTEYIAAVTPGASGNVLTSDGTDWTSAAPSGGGGGGASTPPGRLTLESGVPVSTTDQADKTTLYYTPYVGNQIMLYDGVSAWDTITFSELSLNISAFTASKPYDIWIYNNAGTATLDSTVWTDATTRATALAYQDGRLVKSGATTRLYLGTIYMDAASKCQLKFGLTPAANGSAPKNYVYNEYNKVPMFFMSMDSTDTWAYTTGSYRAKNNSTDNSFKFINGNILNVKAICATSGYSSSANSNIYAGVGVDSVSTRSGITVPISNAAANQPMGGVSSIVYNATPGYHYIQELEYGSATTTLIGDYGGVDFQSGATYEVMM